MNLQIPKNEIKEFYNFIILKWICLDIIMIFDKLIGKCFIFLIITGLGQIFRHIFTKFCSKNVTKMRRILQIITISLPILKY
jgi:hypothetical protein